MSSSQSTSLNLRERLMMSIWWEVKTALLDAWDKQQSSLTQEQERLIQHEISLLSGRLMAFKLPLITDVDSVTVRHFELVPHNNRTLRTTCKVVTNWSTQVGRALESIGTLSVNLPLSPNDADLFVPTPLGVATSHNLPDSVSHGTPVVESVLDMPESSDTNEPIQSGLLAEGSKDTRQKWEIPPAGYTQAAWDEHRADWRRKANDAAKEALYAAVYPHTPKDYRTMLFTETENSKDPQAERVHLLWREWKHHTRRHKHFENVTNNFRVNSRRACYPPPTEGSLHIDYKLDNCFQKCIDREHMDCVVRRVTISAQHAPHVNSWSDIHCQSDVFDKFGRVSEDDRKKFGTYMRKRPKGEAATVNRTGSTSLLAELSSDHRSNSSISQNSPSKPSMKPLALKGSETAGIILPQGAQPAGVQEQGPH